MTLDEIRNEIVEALFKLSPYGKVRIQSNIVQDVLLFHVSGDNIRGTLTMCLEPDQFQCSVCGRTGCTSCEE